MLRNALILLSSLTIILSVSRADEPLRLGCIGSTTGFASTYGTAVLEGVQLGIDELKKNGREVELFIEDDQSAPRMTATAYQKLHSLHKVDLIILGSWWGNSIVEAAKTDGVPIISCETLYNKEFVVAPNYFSIAGDLRDWIHVFEPLVSMKGWKKAVMVRFISGFAETLHQELKAMFSKDGRRLLDVFEYQDFQMQEAASFAARVKALSPDVLYIDAQPGGYATLVQRLIELKPKNLVVLSNVITENAFREKLFNPSAFPGEIYYSRREMLRPAFVEKFKLKYGRDPVLNADLGYYSALLAEKAVSSGKPAADALHSGLEVEGIVFTFDEHNVYRGLKQEMYTFRGGEPIKVAQK